VEGRRKRGVSVCSSRETGGKGGCGCGPGSFGATLRVVRDMDWALLVDWESGEW
jgi:hypothetical protein